MCVCVRVCVCVCVVVAVVVVVVVVAVGDLLFLMSLLNETRTNPGQAVIVLWPSSGFKCFSSQFRLSW